MASDIEAVPVEGRRRRWRLDEDMSAALAKPSGAENGA